MNKLSRSEIAAEVDRLSAIEAHILERLAAPSWASDWYSYYRELLDNHNQKQEVQGFIKREPGEIFKELALSPVPTPVQPTSVKPIDSHDIFYLVGTLSDAPDGSLTFEESTSVLLRYSTAEKDAKELAGLHPGGLTFYILRPVATVSMPEPKPVITKIYGDVE